MTTINNLTIEQMREAFERHQADLTGTDYKELKAHFDNNEQYFSSRYNEGSLYERDWLVWEACWQSRQSEFDAMTEALLNQTQLLAKQKVEIEEKDKRIEVLENRIEEGLGFIDKFHCEGWLSDLDNAEKALRGEQ